MDSRDYPEAYQDLTDYGTKGHVLDKAANEIKKLRQQVAEQANEIASLRKQVAEYAEAIKEHKSGTEKVCLENLWLQKQLAEAKVDAERLDWLSKCTPEIEDYNECWASWGGGTLRDAIDAAMKESKDAD